MTTTTAPLPATSEAVAFYSAALPAIEALCDLARSWRDRAPTDPEAIEAHSEFTWLAIRCDLRLGRGQRALTAEQARGARAELSPPRRRPMPAAPAPGHPQ